MQNFIVLGYIPGTHIQITFGMWLIFLSTLLLIGFMIREHQSIRAWLLGWYVARLIKRHQLAV